MGFLTLSFLFSFVLHPCDGRCVRVVVTAVRVVGVGVDDVWRGFIGSP